MSTSALPVALTIAGSDSGGGAGIQADLKTFAALEVYGCSVLTALTAQNTRTVAAVHAVPPAFIADQITTVLEDIAVNAIKIGMLHSPAVIEAVAGALEGVRAPIVLDPVMVAKSGHHLLAPEAVATLKTTLLPRAGLITPNLPEAACLLGLEAAQLADSDEGVRIDAARALQDLGAQAVLLKGGHGTGAQCEDILVGECVRVFTNPRQATSKTHGTGCTLSAAIAAGLATGVRTLEEAVGHAIEYLAGAIEAGGSCAITHDRQQPLGPVHHFYRLWGGRG